MMKRRKERERCVADTLHGDSHERKAALSDEPRKQTLMLQKAVVD